MFDGRIKCGMARMESTDTSVISEVILATVVFYPIFAPITLSWCHLLGEGKRGRAVSLVTW